MPRDAEGNLIEDDTDDVEVTGQEAEEQETDDTAVEGEEASADEAAAGTDDGDEGVAADPNETLSRYEIPEDTDTFDREAVATLLAKAEAADDQGVLLERLATQVDVTPQFIANGVNLMQVITGDDDETRVKVLQSLVDKLYPDSGLDLSDWLSGKDDEEDKTGDELTPEDELEIPAALQEKLDAMAARFAPLEEIQKAMADHVAVQESTQRVHDAIAKVQEKHGGVLDEALRTKVSALSIRLAGADGDPSETLEEAYDILAQERGKAASAVLKKQVRQPAPAVRKGQAATAQDPAPTLKEEWARANAAAKAADQAAAAA